MGCDTFVTSQPLLSPDPAKSLPAKTWHKNIRKSTNITTLCSDFTFNSHCSNKNIWKLQTIFKFETRDLFITINMCYQYQQPTKLYQIWNIIVLSVTWYSYYCIVFVWELSLCLVRDLISIQHWRSSSSYQRCLWKYFHF